MRPFGGPDLLLQPLPVDRLGPQEMMSGVKFQKPYQAPVNVVHAFWNFEEGEPSHNFFRARLFRSLIRNFAFEAEDFNVLRFKRLFDRIVEPPEERKNVNSRQP